MIELFDASILKILTVFSISQGSRLNRKTIKEKTMIPNVVLDKNLSKLLNLRVLSKERNLFFLNFKNNKIKYIIEVVYEKYAQLKQLPLKEYFIILNLTDKLSETKNINDVYLFGSYAKLIFTESSDIDIAIISDGVDKKEVKKIIDKLEKKHKKRIEVHYFTRKFYVNKRDRLVKEILQHGIKII